MKRPLVRPTSDQCANCSIHCKSAFKELKPSHSSLLDKIRMLNSIKQGQKLSFNNKGGVGFYCIRSGHVRLDCGSSSKLNTIRICGPGDLIGYMMPDTYTIHALEDSELCFIRAEPFFELQRTVPEISLGVIQSLIKIISLKDERISGLENHSVKNRIASTLLSLMKKFGASSAHGTLIDVKIDRKTLANLAGTVVESLARTLTEMEESKVIFRQGRIIHIVDQQKLSRMANS